MAGARQLSDRGTVVGIFEHGTRFGKFIQPGAATTIAEKFADAGEVNRLTGASPTVALHVLWDLPRGAADVAEIRALEAEHGVRAGSINPNLFQSQEYKFGSICNPDAGVRRVATEHLVESVKLGQALGSRDLSMWVSDGSNYPGTQDRCGKRDRLDGRSRFSDACTRRLDARPAHSD